MLPWLVPDVTGWFMAKYPPRILFNHEVLWLWSLRFRGNRGVKLLD